LQPIDRGLLFIYTLFLTLLFIALVPFLSGWLDAGLVGYLRFKFSSYFALVYVFLGLFILIGVRLFWASVKPPPKPRQVIVHEGADGLVSIALPAIEDLVAKVVAQNNGVWDVKATVLSLSEGIGIRVQAAVSSDLQIPDLSKVIQEQVREKILDVTGVTVQQVHVFVHSIAARKQRVE